MCWMADQNSKKNKRKSGRQNCLSTVKETLDKWERYYESSDGPVEPPKPAKGSKKGCMKGKGGPLNSTVNYRGVRQRHSGKWVAEIREPKGGKRLWLGTFESAVQAALEYDKAARKMYREKACVNFPVVTQANSNNDVSSTSSLERTLSASLSGDSDDGADHHLEDVNKNKRNVGRSFDLNLPPPEEEDDDEEAQILDRPGDKKQELPTMTSSESG